MARKPDPAEKETDMILRVMERRIQKEYEKAEQDLQAKVDDYFERFRLKDQKWREWVADGTKTKDEYKQWRIGQMAVGDRWELMKTTISKELYNAEKISKSIVKGYMPEVYALNFNYGTYQAEMGAHIDTSFTLYDRQTVERIMRDDPEMLPAPGKKVSKEIEEGRAIRWNRQQVQSVMVQGILQGESIPALASRLAKEVGDSDMKASIRNARTMTTGAQNAGRVDSYKRAENMGIEMEQMWRSTLDMRTRHEHRMLDGVRVKVGTPFTVDGYSIMFPGDPSADPEMIYNCRCTLEGVVAGLEKRAMQDRDTSAIDGMSYQEWKASKLEKPEPILSQKEKGEAIAESYRAEYRGRGGGPGKMQEGEKLNPVNKNGDEITFDFKNDKHDDQIEIIKKLSNEYNTRLEKVTSGAQVSAGDVDITGSVMRLSSSQEITALHEFAHTLANSNADKYGITNDSDFWKEIKKVRREYLKEVGRDTSRWISSYEHSHKEIDEFFAEAFTHAKSHEIGIEIPERYGNDFTYSQKVLDIIDKYFKKR